MTELVRVPSSGFYKFLDKIAENEKTTRDYFEEAVTLARREKFTDLEIALLMKDYLKDKISRTTLWRWTKSLEPKEEIEESTSESAPMEQIVEKKEPEQIPTPTKIELLEIENKQHKETIKQKEELLQAEKTRGDQLEDALRQTEQFKPGTVFLGEKSQEEIKEIKDELASGTTVITNSLDDDTVFKYLKDRAKETGDILDFGRVGSGALVQALAQYKNSFGVVELFGRVVKK